MAEPPKEQEVLVSDLLPDGWERFTKAVDAAVKSGPKHREAASANLSKEKVPKPR